MMTPEQQALNLEHLRSLKQAIEQGFMNNGWGMPTTGEKIGQHSVRTSNRDYSEYKNSQESEKQDH